MSIDNAWGNTVASEDGDGEIMQALAADDAPRHGDQNASEWMKTNLFGSVFSTVFTVLFGTLSLYLGYRAARYFVFTADWEPVRSNLELFMLGLFPRTDRTRMVVQALMVAGSAGLLIGWMRQQSIATAEQAGLERESSTAREVLSNYWGVGAFITFCMVVGVRTVDPWLLLLGVVTSVLAGYLVCLRPRRGAAGILLALVPLVPLVIAGAVLSLIQDLDNSMAYLIAGAVTVLLALVQYLRTPSFTLSAGLLLGTAGFATLSGTYGLTWIYVTAALAPYVLHLLGSVSERLPTAAGWIGSFVCILGGLLLVSLAGLGLESIIVFGIAASGITAARRGDVGPGVRLGVFTVIGVGTWQIGRLIDLPGISWDEWGGLQLNLVAAAATTLLAFPIGLLLALGRRSSLPVLRVLCTAYIEVFRGVPLITLLFMAQLFIGFFLNGQNLPLVTKSIIVFTMFSSAYIAEIVRGGLQAVPSGQTEAGQAMGMSPAAITRLLVLPQALKAVIPAMVGQFISLFKDTSLLSFIGIFEFLGVRDIVHAQEAFRGVGIDETLVFVAFGFWAFSFTMSRESQRLERRLDTGNR